MTILRTLLLWVSASSTEILTIIKSLRLYRCATVDLDCVQPGGQLSTKNGSAVSFLQKLDPPRPFSSCSLEIFGATSVTRHCGDYWNCDPVVPVCRQCTRLLHDDGGGCSSSSNAVLPVMLLLPRMICNGLGPSAAEAGVGRRWERRSTVRHAGFGRR